jgi:hypothetical protein
VSERDWQKVPVSLRVRTSWTRVWMGILVTPGPHACLNEQRLCLDGPYNESRAVNHQTRVRTGHLCVWIGVY